MSKMVAAIGFAAIVCLFHSPGAAATRDRFVGTWQSLDTDARKFQLAQTKDGWEMTAPDLHCTFKTVHGHEEEEAVAEQVGTILANVESVCSDEGTTTYSMGQMKLFGNSDYLVMADMVKRRVDEKDADSPGAC